VDGRGASESRRRPRQRRLALLVLLTAVALAAAAYPLRTRWWGGLVLAVAEAGIVGGLADWFAVTALFRHPLGLPIPHTAIIPANWELMAQRVGSMVGDRVLTKDYVTQEISRFDVAELLARGAERLKAADLEAVVRAVGRWVAEQVTPTATGDAALWLTRLARANPIAPLLATGIELARKQGWDQRLIEAVAVAARAGVDPTRAVEILQASSGRSNASDNKFPRFILNGAFDAGFAIRLMMKDLDGYGRLAQEAGVPSPVARAAAEVYRVAMARGMAEQDHTAIARIIEEWAGVSLRSPGGKA